MFRYKGEENILPGSLALARMAGFDATRLPSISGIAEFVEDNVSMSILDVAVEIWSSFVAVSGIFRHNR